jgi:outer membrane protein insertion porin family
MGYLYAVVEPRKQYLDPTGPLPEWAGPDEQRGAVLNVVLDITEADQYTVGRVDIRGNDTTQGRVIRRQLRFYPEQLLNTKAVEESRHRLLETRLFDEASITPTGEAPGVRDVLVRISEARTANFLIGVGVSTNSGLLGSISFVQRNFDILNWPRSLDDLASPHAWKGAGQTLSVVAEPGTELMRFQVSWFEPYLFDQPFTLGAKGFLFTRGRESYDETRYGGVFSFGHRFKNRWYGELSNRVEGVEVDNLTADAPIEVVRDSGTHMLVGLKGTLVRDRTDSRWMPSRGDRLRVSYEQVVSEENFGVASGDYRIYHTAYTDALERKHILAGRLVAGHIFGDAPVFERFYGGGLGSVRGFEYRGISPRGTASNDPIGGDFMAFAGAEYDFPLVGQNLRGVVFVDSGTVEPEVTITTWRVAAGVGLRWTVPIMGPVPWGLNFGWPLVKDDDDDTALLSFTMGWSF